MKGKFIVFEGIDGCGKTTQINQIAEWLKTLDLIPKENKLVITREPGGTKLGQSLRSLLLETSKENIPNPITELLLYAADRAQHINQIIQPSLKRGDWVISDRYSGSTIAYQGYGRELDIKLITELEKIATNGLIPDITLLLDIPINESIKRRIQMTDDRIEKEGESFLEKVSVGFKILSKERKWKRISANRSREDITSEIKREIIKALKAEIDL